MKTNLLSFLFLFSFSYSLSFSAFAQSIGFSAGTTLMHISKANFNSSANLSDFQVASYNRQLSFGINFEYSLSSRLRLRAEVNYFNTNYELRLYYGNNVYRSKGFGFSNIQVALLADMTILPISAKSYLTAYSGLGIAYTTLNLMRTGLHSRSGGFSTFTTTFEDNTMLITNSKASVTAIIGLSLQKLTRKGKFSIGVNYNRAFTSSPSADLKLTMIQTIQGTEQSTNYDQTLSPHLHFLNISVGYAWFLKKQKK